MAELERCIGFLCDHAFRVTRPGRSGRFGTALLRPELPRVWSLNYLLADRELNSATAEDLAEEADELLGSAGLQHRKIEVLDGSAGARLAEEFRALGWHVERDLVLPHRRPPDRGADISSVEEVDAETLASTWVDGMRPDFGRDEEVIGQLVEHKRVLAADGARFFAARVEGSIAAYCDLYSDDKTGQIEAVMTLEPFRNQGLARAVVTAALAASSAAGNDLTFLLADDADWPKHLYEKLGFDAVGDIYEFTLRDRSHTSPI
jgi:GNAT superfamily N-acetyltransferase